MLTLEVGKLYDVKGASSYLNMFFPAYERWDVCRLLRILDDGRQGGGRLEFEPVDRVNPYSYLYPEQTFARRKHLVPSQQVETHVAPLLSRVVRVSPPREAREYDLVDYEDDDGEINVYEVASNIGSFLWLVPVTIYTSAEFKDSLRRWVEANDPRLYPYRSQEKKMRYPVLLRDDRLIGYKYQFARSPEKNQWTRVQTTTNASPVG